MTRICPGVGRRSGRMSQLHTLLLSLPLRPSGAHCCVEVEAVQGSPRDEHVAASASRVGSVALVQNYYCVLDMPVYEVDVEVSSGRPSPLAPLHRARKCPC